MNAYLDARANALGVAAARDRCRLEIELLGAILCRPADLLPAALGHGVTPDLFAFPDLRAAFEAAAYARRTGLGADELADGVAWCFRLRGWWRDDFAGRQLGHMVESMHWSARMVWALFHQNFPAAPNVRRAAAALAARVRATREADEHLAHAVRLLGGQAPALTPAAAGLHLVRLARLAEVPVEQLADAIDQVDQKTRRVA